MNSLTTLAALNQVVNHDVCPQMKRLIAENKRLEAKNKILIRIANRTMTKLNLAHGREMRLRKYSDELEDWKDWMLNHSIYKCCDCNEFCEDDEGDEEVDDEDIIAQGNGATRCCDCVAYRTKLERLTSLGILEN